MKVEMRKIILKQLDRNTSLLHELTRSIPRPSRGWLRAVREAIGLSQGQAASRLGLTRGAWTKLEKTEEREHVTLATLRRAADALGCEMVYALVPRGANETTFTELATANDPATHHLAASEHSMALEGQAVGDLGAKEQRSQ